MTSIALGGLWHETNTFVPGRTQIEDFQRYQFARGDALLQTYAGTGTELGGAIAAARESGAQMAPLAFAAAVPSGIVAQEAFEELLHAIVGQARRSGALDGIVFALHGAMAVEGHPDPETEVVRAMREVVGDVPIAVTLDLHANLGPALCGAADVIVGYDTFPHVDMAERGAEALRLVMRMAAGGTRPVTYLEKLPLLTVPQMQATGEEPMHALVEILHDVEAADGVWTASLLPGYPYCDVDRLGFAVYVAADVNPWVLARYMASAAWSRRDAFCPPPLLDPESAVCEAAQDPGPVVLVDVADNVGGGSPGNGTVLLQALEDRGGCDGVVVIWDPTCLDAIYRTTGERIAVEVGSSTCADLGRPVHLAGRARRLGRVTYRRAGPYMRGQPVDMGRVAVIESGVGAVVVTEHRVMPFDDDHLRVVGVEPERRRIIVAKSAMAWKAAFGAYATRALFVRTPGYCPSDLRQLALSRRPRPAYPLEEETTWSVT